MSVRNNVSVTITAQNQFSPALLIQKGESASISVSATAMVANVRLQRNLDGTNWRNVEVFTAATEQTYVADESCEIRIGCPTGDFTSATALVARLGL